MRNLLALIGLTVVVVAGLGWYLGWYKLQTDTAATGHREFHVDVDTNKISTDVKKGEQRLQKAITPDGSTAPAPQQIRPVQGQPTSNKRTGMQVNDDGSVTLKSSFTLPALVPGQNSK
jgi:hypothetical protein